MATANITRAMLSDKEFLEKCIDRNLSFLKSIPNSVQYWQQRKRDLFAMIRQLGKPTMFLTLSASETKWTHLLQTLQRLSDGRSNNELQDVMQQLTALQRATLVNQDPVTCCIYFNKLVDIIMQLLQSPRYSPFGQYRVVDYFKRIEFQHRGSPHAHILIWLAGDPCEVVSESMPATVNLIDNLCSVRATDLSENYSNQVHKHTFTCFKRNEKRCRFNIPYWPMDQTRVLLPIPADDGRREQLKRCSAKIKEVLETKVFETFEHFLDDCNCTYDYYLDVIRASINRPTIMLKRSMTELWTNPFNPWIANVLRSNMDLQFIPEAFSCAAYVVEYVNKTNRGISSLHRDLVKLQEEYPDQDYTALLKKVSIKMLNSVEMSAQEAAWYLLRQPMSEASRKVDFLPTMWPHERIKSRKRSQQMDEEGIEDESTDVWTLNIIQKYEVRVGLDDVCLADFAAHYTKERRANTYKLRARPRVLRWCAYSMNELVEYKREMVLLFLPFRNELCDVLDENKFLELYDHNEADILRKCKEYSTDLDLEHTVQEYLRMCAEDEANEQQNVASDKHDEFVRTIAMDPNNDDITHLPIGTLSSVIKQRTNVMSKQDFCAMVRATNAEQRDLVLQVIDGLHNFNDNNKPLQIFFTGPAGCGKTFTLRILMETFNRFGQAQNSQNNAYVACASTGKAAVAINGTTVHSAFRITMARRNNASLSFESLQLYRNAFANIKAIIVDEVSMVGADVLNTIHARLQSITGNYDDPFGGMNIIFCGDLRQLPPVNARPVYKPCANSMHGAVLWQSLDFFPLVRVMRQTDIEFSTVLTKIGNGEQLTVEETGLIESRFRTTEWCKQNVPSAVRLFHRNVDVERYNCEALTDLDGLDCTAEDAFVGYSNVEQLASSRIKLYKMSVVETGCLPYMVRLVVGMPYMVTTNVDVEDGIVNGAIGELQYVEHNEDDPQQSIIKLWLKFDSVAIGAALRIKSRPTVYSKPGILRPDWTPISRRSANIKLSGSIKCKRIQFPVVSASALTVHKSQGGTFNEIVYGYDKSQDQQLVYVGLSRVKSLEGLYLTNSANVCKFHHAKGSKAPKMVELRSETQRLVNHRLQTLGDEIMGAIEACGNACTLMSVNVQSLQAHSLDIATDRILTSVELLALSETWQDNESLIEIDGFNCIVQFKRPNMRAGGVAIYEKITASTMASSHAIERLSEQYDEQLRVADSYGDICAAEIVIMGTPTLLVSVYIMPSKGFIRGNATICQINYIFSTGTTMKQKEYFIARTLMTYARCTMPMIVTGDFNIDVSKSENSGFIEFMKRHLRLTLATDPTQATTLGGSCLDLMFIRNIRAECKRYCSYFTYHRPILSILKI
ncbi:uncharacterized protein LOC135700938 [Ochlerotatus camptorhynchus]|uniref:uncharacterized protein LOC135700938 n=1 Tax=Ochlerotatus camptorhynchus TaxID=644619 RepID=UPI0031DE30FE